MMGIKGMTPEAVMATTWVFGQAIDFIVQKKQFNEFYRKLKNMSADIHDFTSVEAALKTNKIMKKNDSVCRAEPAKEGDEK